jgi:hypothetical protein
MCNSLIEDYTEIFYMIDKGDIPAIHCKMSVSGPKSMRKADGLSLYIRWLLCSSAHTTFQ